MNKLLVASMLVGAGLAIGMPTLAHADDQSKSQVAAPAQAAGGSASSKASSMTVDMNAPLPTDPRLVKGTLPNGLSYIVAKHSNPPGRAMMYIHVSSGSINETDKQRGIAHYLEHMAFNGSENFPPGTVVDFFQSMGLTFGQHQNAFTSFDQTTYILAFPDTKPDTIEKGMRFFSDVAMRLALNVEEIEKERQIIMEEKRTRAGGAQRMQDYVLERLAPGSLIGERLPIGIEKTIMGVQRQDFQDYYTKWYVPSNMTVMVVADEDPQAIVQQITKAFSGGENRPKPVDADAKVTPTNTTRAVVAHDKEQTKVEIEIMRLWPKQSPTTTVGTMRRDLVQNIGSAAFNRRIGAKLAKGGTSYLSASGGMQDLFNTSMMAAVNCEGEPGKWRDMFAEIGTDLQRARLHGFSAREIDDVKKALIASAEQAVQREATAPAQVLMRQLNGSVASGDAHLSAAQELELMQALLPTITHEEISKSFTASFDPEHVTFVVQAPSDLAGGVPSEEEVVKIGRAALNVQPAAESEAERPTTLLAAAPKPGTIAEQSEHAASKVASAVLDNGIVVHHKFMDYRKDTVNVVISVAAGTIQETAANRGVTEAATLGLARPATSTLSSTNIRDIMTGKKVRAGGGVGMDTTTINVAGSPADLEHGMQLAYLLLTDAKIEQAAFDQWKKQQTQEIAERKKIIEGQFAEALAMTVFPASEARTQPLNEAQLGAITLEAAQKWLTNALKTAPIEVTIVGDLPRERAMELAKTYLGSLAKREKITDKTLDDLRVLKKAKGPQMTERVMDTVTDKAYVASGFYAADFDNVVDRRNLQFASRVMSTRMLKRIREEEQLSYSPSAGNRPAMDFPGFGTFAMITQTKPTKVDRLVAVAKELYDDFAKGGPTAEEMETVKKQIANQLDEQMREPAFWTTQTSMLTYRGVKLDDVLAGPEYFQALSADKVKETFNKYYTDDSRMTVVVKPKTSSEAAEGASSEGAKPAAKP